MPGEWLPSEAPPHKCDLPAIWSSRPLGSRWRCDCGATFVTVLESQHGESWRRWKRETAS